jgi:site-specific recombinase XerD
MTPIAPHISAFLQKRLPLERGASEHTRDAYAYAFRLLFEFASERRRIAPSDLNVEDVDADLVLAFLEHIEKSRHNSPRTRNARLAAIKSFMHFLEHRVPSALDQIRRVLAIPSKRTDIRLVNHLTVTEMQAVLDSPDPHMRGGIRDRAMMYVGFMMGLRVSEIIGLRQEDVVFHPHACLRVRGKGRRERILPFSKETARVLRAWVAIRGESAMPELFLNRRQEPLTRSGFEYILRKHAERARRRCRSLARKRISPHVLRHTCAMNTLQATKDIRRVSLWLGHASLQTTEVYTRADPTQKLAAVAAIVPPHLRPGRFQAPDRLLSLLDRRPLPEARPATGAAGSPRRNAQPAATDFQHRAGRRR